MQKLLALLAGLFLAIMLAGCGTGQNRYGEYVALPEVEGIAIDGLASHITTWTKPENPYYVDLEVSYRDSQGFIRHMSENDLAASTSGSTLRIVWEVSYSGQGLIPGRLYTAVVSTGAKYREYYGSDGDYYMELRETFRTFEILDGQVISSRAESKTRTLNRTEAQALRSIKGFSGDE